MKKNIQTTLIALFALLPLGMQAQRVDFSKYEGSQILNSDFETWADKDGNAKAEPRYWHSFESASGDYASAAKGRLSKVEGRRPNGKGSFYCQIQSTKYVAWVVNGTMTTGHLNAGSMNASSSDNHAKISSSDSDIDNYGDPFFSILTSRPDSLVLWVKFSQGTANSAHPYATISAAITNGNYYQEPAPEDVDYSSALVGYAENRKIATTNNSWKRISLKFNYDGYNNGNPALIMITASTNADAGQGSKGDLLLIDDLELVYNRPVTIPESGYLMMTNLLMKNYKIVIPEGITAYTLEANSEGSPKVKDVYKPGQVLPYEAAVLLEGKPGEHAFSTTIYEAEDIVAEGDLCIVKSTELNTPTEEYKFFRLSTRNGILGFYPVSHGMEVPESESLLRVKSYLAAENYQHVLYKRGKKGDVDGDGNVNATDVKALVDRLLGNELGMKGFLVPDADVNNDGRTTVADVTNLVNILMNE